MSRYLLLTAVVTLAACVDHEPSLLAGKTTSLKVNLITPADPGSQNNRLPAGGTTTATITITALDENGNTDTSVSKNVDLYVGFLGSLTPPHEKGVPFQKVMLNAGVSATTTVMLPPTFGPTFLWVEDVEGSDPSYATGTSPQIWFRDPFIADTQRPVSETAVNALTDSPLENKTVDVTASRYGAMGRLVVSGVYATGYTLDDVQCQDANGTPPCQAGDYDHAFIYSYSKAVDQFGATIVTGENITGFQGGISEFDGLTEVGFPQSFVANPAVTNTAEVSTPVKVDMTWFSNLILFERAESGLIEVDNGTLCPLDTDWTTYNQWKLDIGAGCTTPINVITAGVINFDPTPYVGKVIPKVVGTMRPINIGSFNVWLMYPRFDQDLVLQ
jgi:hypothetical protein